MPIRDLLGACPACGGEGEFRRSRWKGEWCGGCGARFRRTSGSAIEMRAPDGSRAVRPATEWVRASPAEAAGLGLAGRTHGQAGIRGVRPELQPDGTPLQSRGAPLRQSDVIVRRRVRQEPIRTGGTYLNRIDRFGAPEPGVLILQPDAIRFRPERRDPERWPLDDIAAVGSSSGTLQLRLRHGRVLAIAFPADSLRLWEEAVRAALRSRYRADGRGEIIEFQPRILTR